MKAMDVSVDSGGGGDDDHELGDHSSGEDSATGADVAATEPDNDLTNLTWLQDRNLLQNMQVCGAPHETTRLPGLDDVEDNENVSPPPPADPLQAGDGATANSKGMTSVPPVTYNPHLHRNAKPPYSFSSLIFMAIESSPNKALPVKDIYQWIVEHYPYYQTAPSGWKNTVRHNLSLNKCFRKLDKANDDLLPIAGKGSLWCVDPDLRPNLLQAVRRTPAHIYPYMSLAKTNAVVSPPRIQLSSHSNNSSQPSVKKALSSERVQSVVNIPSPNLFPFLSRRLLIPITKIIKKEKETDAAVSMLTLQSNVNNTGNTGAAVRDNECEEEVLPDAYVDDLDAPVVTVTVSPTGDHNYYQRNSALLEGQQIYHVIQVTGQQQPQQQPTVTDHNLRSAATGGSNRRKVQAPRGGLKRAAPVVADDNDSNDEGMRGAEALLKLAAASNASNAKHQTLPAPPVSQQPAPPHERPIILKKCKKE